jgi:hypothetical protein
MHEWRASQVADYATSLNAIEEGRDAWSGRVRHETDAIGLEQATPGNRGRAVGSLQTLQGQPCTGGIHRALSDEGPQGTKHGPKGSHLNRRHAWRRGGIGGDRVMESVGSWLECHAADGSAAGLL